MHAQPTERANRGICVVRGYGIKITVQRGHLTVHDGVADRRRTRRYHRTSKLKRLVLIGNAGYLTIDALRWLHDVGAALIHLDTRSQLITTSVARGPDFAALRRAQALAANAPAGLEIARGVLTAKVEGQLALLGELPGGTEAREPVQSALGAIESATELGTLLAAEAQAAAAYWLGWAPLPLPFPSREARTVPHHWLTFGQRASLLTGGPRLATNPVGAILNYLYALLEAETVFACHAVGLDPGLGIFHTDQRDRASLALDIMEAARPAVDAYVLALVTQRTLSAHAFVETREGGCRITPRFAEELAATCEVWRSHVAPVVEDVAHTLADYSPSKLPAHTPLTRRNRKRAWDERAPDRRRRRSRSEFAQLPSTCRDCGNALDDRRHRYCEQCRAPASPSEDLPLARRRPRCSRSCGQSSVIRRMVGERPRSVGERTPRTRRLFGTGLASAPTRNCSVLRSYPGCAARGSPTSSPRPAYRSTTAR
jgi:CRISPR-associated protein Cas1